MSRRIGCIRCGTGRSGIRARILRIGPAWRIGLCAAVTACARCDDTTATRAEDRYSIACDPAALTFEIQHASATPRSAGIDLVASDVRFDPVSYEVRVRVALHNGRGDEFLGPRGVEAFAFDASVAWPVNAGCSPPVPGDLPMECVFWHWDSYGDRMLSAGETSAPVEWILRDSTGAPFTFHARLWWPHGAP